MRHLGCGINVTDKTIHGSKVKNPGRETPQRPEHPPEDDRPLAEIRKSIHDALRIVSLHRWAFFIPFSLIASVAFLGSLYLPRTYTASTTFDRRNDPVIMNLPMSPGAASFSHFRSTMERDLTSVPNIAESVEKAGLTKDFEHDAEGKLTPKGERQRNSLAASLASTLSISKISPNEQLDIITITYTGPDATIGKSLVEQLKKVYVARTMVWVGDFLRAQRDYLVKQSTEALEELRAAQREETRVRLENPHFDPNDPGGLITRVAQLEIERRELDLRRLEYEAELTALDTMLATTQAQSHTPATSALPADYGAMIMTTPRALRLQGQLATMIKEIDNLRDTRGMTDEHPQIKVLLADIKKVEGELDEVRAMGQPAAPAEAEQAVASVPIEPQQMPPYWNAELARLKVQIEAQKSKIKDVDLRIETNEAAITELRDARQVIYQSQEVFVAAIENVSKSKQKYNQLESAVAAIDPTIKATEQGRLIQFSEGQPSRATPIPIKPKAQTIVFLALFAGAIAGAIFVIIAEVFDHVFRTSTQVSRSLGIPILEAIDEIVTTTDRRKHLIRNAVVAPIFFLLFAALAGGTGMLAYLSIEQPWTYEKIMKLPNRAARYVIPNSSLTAERPSEPKVIASAAGS